MELSDYRNQIDHIDKELIRLFAERMDVAAGIAAYKKEKYARFGEDGFADAARAATIDMIEDLRTALG